MRISVALFVCAALVGGAHAEDVRTVAKATYAGIDQAFVKRDIRIVRATMAPRVTPGFRAIAGGQSLTCKQLLANFQSIFKQFRKIDGSTSTIETSDVHGGTATLRVSGTLTALAAGPDGKSHKVDLHNVSEDVWKLVAGKWKWAKSTTLSQTTRVDGKRITGLG